MVEHSSQASKRERDWQYRLEAKKIQSEKKDLLSSSAINSVLESPVLSKFTADSSVTEYYRLMFLGIRTWQTYPAQNDPQNAEHRLDSPFTW